MAASPPASANILPLLKKISTSRDTIAPDDITDALSLIFLGQLSAVQTGALLTSLHYTGLDCSPAIIAAAATAMRAAGLRVHSLPAPAPSAPASAPTPGGTYSGGLVDIVGTGGDGHDTFNVSTSAAILAAGCGLRIAKHGNRASTSASGSADLLISLGASLTSVTPSTTAGLLSRSRFAFLFAPVFHPGMRHVAPVRKELGCRTIFNLLGPLANPIDSSQEGGLEARIVGVGRRELGHVFAESLRLLGVRQGMVVCGDEELDEVSCAGATRCWRIAGEEIEEFSVHPTETFGLRTHPLAEVAGGKSPDENAAILKELLNGQRGEGDPIRDFVVANAAALLVVAGVGGGTQAVGEDGVMRGTAWTNAVELCEATLKSGEAWRQWEAFALGTQECETEIKRETEEVKQAEALGGPV